jgi:hypothetical protein
VARAEIRPEGRDLALERRERGRNERLSQAVAEIGQQVAGGEIVAAVGDQIIAADQRRGDPRETVRDGIDHPW